MLHSFNLKCLLIVTLSFSFNIIAKTYWVSTKDDYQVSFIEQNRTDSLLVISKMHDCNNLKCYFDTLNLKYVFVNDSFYIANNSFKVSNDTILPNLKVNNQITPFIVDTFIMVSDFRCILERLDKIECSKSKLYKECRDFYSPSLSLGYSYPSNTFQLSLFSMKMAKSDKFLYEYEFMGSQILLNDKYNDKFNASSNFLFGMLQFLIIYTEVGPTDLKDAKWDLLWVIYNGRVHYKIDRNGYYKMFVGNHFNPFLFRHVKWVSHIFEIGFEMNRYYKNISFPIFFSVDYKKPFNHTIGFSVDFSFCEL